MDREPSDAMFLLRCLELGISVRDLELLDIGIVYDMITERENDACEYPYKAMQEDIDKFVG